MNVCIYWNDYQNDGNIEMSCLIRYKKNRVFIRI